MHRETFYHTSSRAIAVIGNFLPRQCGIATFTTDLVEALVRIERFISSL